jgi:riboflavin biosynthesis pyrimidine reductase
MEDAKVTAEELEEVLSEDIHRLAKEIAEAMNSAQPGRIIADSEEPVRDAHAEFRQRAYQKALSLLQKKQEAFSPSAERTEEQGTPQRNAPDDQRANAD